MVLRQCGQDASLPRRRLGDHGFYNLAGFNDDTRAFASIPSRHDVWRVSCDWLAGLVVQGLLAGDEAHSCAISCAYGLTKRAYRAPETAHVTR